MYLSGNEFARYCMELEKHHAIFYALWKCGKPRFSNEIQTAAIRFNKHGGYLEFLFNESFWNKLSDNERMFVICHEMLHVILNHGRRTLNAKDARRTNVSLDVAVNHLLVSCFGFDRDSLPVAKDACWIDTVFSDPSSILPEQCSEYYYNRITATPKSSLIIIDDHSGLSGVDADAALDAVGDLLSDDEKQSIRDAIGRLRDEEDLSGDDKEGGQKAGNGKNGSWLTVDAQPVHKKKKWETIIKRWSRKYLRQADPMDVEQWIKLHRRLHLLKGDLLLPSDAEEEKEEPRKINVWFFQDTSGSCAHLVKRFFRAAKTLPTRRFKIRAFTFSTVVHEADLETGRIHVGGGTSFSIIEKKIQDEIKNGDKYPDAVFIITDGYGNKVNPQYPERWYFFLSTRCIHFVPPKSQRFMLSNFE